MNKDNIDKLTSIEYARACMKDSLMENKILSF